MSDTKLNYSLYLVTDRQILAGRELCACVEQAIRGGVTLVQLREKTVSSLEFYQVACKLRQLTDDYKVPLIINDRLDIALAVEAAGLHIGQDDMPAEIARRLLGPGKILGVSVSSVEEARAAVQAGADYLGVGAVFPTASKADANAVSFGELARIKRAVDVPVVAIGGIAADNLAKVRAVGVDGAAVISAILGRQDCHDAAQGLARIWAEN